MQNSTEKNPGSSINCPNCGTPSGGSFSTVMEADDSGPTKLLYKCKTCGLVTTDKGHLCKPQEVKKAYSCEYCGMTVSNPRHVCKPKVAKLNYVCDTCGRVAVKKEEICKPAKIKK